MAHIELVPYPMLDELPAWCSEWEAGHLADPEIVGLFQVLIGTGLAWHKGANYFEAAWYMICKGYCGCKGRA